MTTVTFRSGVLAFDSKITEDTLICGKSAKGRAYKNYLAAACGSMQDIQAFLDWVGAGFKEEDKKKFGLDAREVEISGIVVDRKMNVLLFDNRLYPYPLEAPFYAFGSGAHLAIGAMAHGASAYKAVKIASQYDANTGGDIKLLTFRKRKAKANALTPTK